MRSNTDERKLDATEAGALVHEREQESLLEKQCPKTVPTHTSDKRKPWDTQKNDDRTAGRRTGHDKEEHNQTEHHEILKPTRARHLSGRGLHAAERTGEAQNPGPDK